MSQAAPSSIDLLIRRMAQLPGVGPRSARRMVLHLLQKRESKLLPLIEAMQHVEQTINECIICGNLDVVTPCHICRDPLRDGRLLCVVEDVADVWAMERSGLFRGRYHVLGGVLNALDGVHPEQLRISALITRILTASTSVEHSDAEHDKPQPIEEIIIATNATIDGQTTAFYIHEQVQQTCEHPPKMTRLAQGMPMGGELDYVDEGTLSTALQARSVL